MGKILGPQLPRHIKQQTPWNRGVQKICRKVGRSALPALCCWGMGIGAPEEASFHQVFRKEQGLDLTWCQNKWEQLKPDFLLGAWRQSNSPRSQEGVRWGLGGEDYVRWKGLGIAVVSVFRWSWVWVWQHWSYYFNRMLQETNRSSEWKSSAQKGCRCSVAKLCPTVCYPMDCSMLGFCILPFAQVHVDWVGDAIERSHLPLKREKPLILADPGHPLQ